MTVRVERIVTLPVEREKVWAFIADPEKRARPISVVEDFELKEDGTAVWHLKLPVPFIDRTVAVETHETVRREPEYVEFEGRSRVMHVIGEHELDSENGRTTLTNRFTVEGRIPGVERFFRKNMEREFDNLENALYEELGIEQ